MYWETGHPDFGMLYKFVEALPDRRADWNKQTGAFSHWEVPATIHLARSVVDVFGAVEGMEIDPEVQAMADKVPPKPKNVRSKKFDRLYPFQIDGVNWLRKIGGRALLADDMGLGKTVMALVYLNQLSDVERGRTLCVVPASVLYKWEWEAKEWAPNIKSILVADGGKAVIGDEELVIISYSMATRRYDELAMMGFTNVILDESHYLKNPKSKRTRSSQFYLSQAPRVLMLSGTPFLNRPYEMWQLLTILQPDQWGSQFNFGRRYADGRQNEFGYWEFKGQSNIEELREKLDAVMLRRTKREARPHLPPLTISHINVRGKYRFKKKAGESKIVALGREYREIGVVKAKLAIPWITNFLDQYIEEKLVVYAHHLEVVDFLKEQIEKKANILPVEITGRVSNAQRQKIVDAFQKTLTPRLLVINSAAAVGINLHRASHMLMVEREWSPALERQIWGRLDREGQENPVFIHAIRLENTVDDYFAELADEKNEFFNSSLGMDIPEQDINRWILDRRDKDE
jgi:SWI/SNF-related matrix-associated actin-dependent regulator 1 of chromatin subfamily A